MPFVTRLLFLCALLCLSLPARAATNAFPQWNDYRVIMWTGGSAWKNPAKLPLYFERLREMGVNATSASGDSRVQIIASNQFNFYVENMVNRGLCLKFSSSVTNWDAFVTQWVKEGRSESALVRDYSLDDPTWQKWARNQMQSQVRSTMASKPLAYDIRDELSTTVSANPFDYDFSPVTLAQFRVWLKTQYADLAALNTKWETKFATWEDVRPFTTDQIKHRMATGEAIPRGKVDWAALRALKFDPATARQSPTRWNFSPWADFRTYMDLSLARTLNDIRTAARELDPHTPVGIEGTQMPSAFGGYDLWRLSQALDWIEPYDIACSREIFGSFMPGQPMLATVFEKDTNHAARRLWHLLLLGDRGCITWWSEDCIDWKSPDYALTAKGRALGVAFKEMTSPLAKIFLRAERVVDPVLIHYSQASIQADWLLESQGDGSSWLRRFSSYEASHNRQAQVRTSWLLALTDLGFAPRFISTEQIERGALADLKNSALILPGSLALSDREAEALRAYTKPGSQTHALITDGSPGMFDDHGRVRSTGALENHFPPASSAEKSYALLNDGKITDTKTGDITAHGRERLKPGFSAEWLAWLEKSTAHIPREVTLPPDARVRVHRYQLGDARLLAFERNISYQMSEDLKQAGGNENLEKPFATTAQLAKPAHVYDLRAKKYLGHTDAITLDLNPWSPSLYAVLPEKLSGDAAFEKLLQLAEAAK